MWILIVLFLIIVPFFIGCVVRKLTDPFGEGCVDTYLSGVLTLFALSGSVQLFLVLGQKGFVEYIIIYVTLLFLLFIPGILLFGVEIRKKRRERTFTERFKGFCRSWFVDRASQIFSFLTILVFLVCFVRVVFGTVDLRGDFTLETVQTTLETDTIYEYNSFTGQVLKEGMPIRQKILTMPFFLAMLCEICQVDPSILVYRVFPCFVLIWTILMYARWGSLLYSKQREKESGFLLLIGVLLLFGDYARLSPAALLLHQGFTGNAFCAAVVIPYCIYLCMKEKWVLALLCIATEIFLIWTTYGFGYCFLIVLFFAMWKIGQNIYRKKRKA